MNNESTDAVVKRLEIDLAELLGEILIKGGRARHRAIMERIDRLQDELGLLGFKVTITTRADDIRSANG